MWIFLGWEFTLAEFVGGLILIVLMWVALRIFVSRREEERAREHALAAESGHQHQSAGGGSRLLSLDAWSDVAHNFRGDWGMLWKEITAGFLIAGFIALLPMDFFNDLFLTGTGGWVQLLENVLVGPLVAVLSFVCSVGNVPLAAVLWAGGISFSGVIAFIYADLIIIPLVLVYGRYYGWRVAALLVTIMFAAIVAAALAVDGIFSVFGLIPEERPSIDSITERGISWNYTTLLNIVFTLVAAGLIGLTTRRGARDPVCGMTVDLGRAVTSEHGGRRYFFCGPGCRTKFEADPERYAAGEASAARAEPASRH
jgi:YHS domain-containing protein